MQAEALPFEKLQQLKKKISFPVWKLKKKNIFWDKCGEEQGRYIYIYMCAKYSCLAGRVG